MRQANFTGKPGSFFGRRCGKSLSASQKALIETILPVRKIRLDALSDIDAIYNLFSKSAQLDKLHLEIGFGGGEHLLHQASQYPNTGFIGVEPFVNSLVKILKPIEAHKELYQNILLYDEDASKLLAALPDNSLSGIDLFYPDPWPKARQQKRRFVNEHNLKEMVRVLKHGGSFRFASDIANYVDWTLRLAGQTPCLEWQACTKNDWKTPHNNWVSTRYEQKALQAGRQPSYLHFIIRKS